MFALIGIALLYLIIVVICWKTFYWFQTTWIDHATKTGFSMFLSRLFFALVMPIIILYFGLAVFGIAMDPSIMSTPPKSTDNKQKSSSTQNNNYNNNAVTTPKENQNKSSEAQYDGDDPIVRARLGLPPKE